MQIKFQIKRIISRILVNFARKCRKKSLQEAIDKANKITGRTGKKCLIYLINGQYEVYTKQDVKKVKHRGHFKELSMQELLGKAQIITMKHHSPKKVINE